MIIRPATRTESVSEYYFSVKNAEIDEMRKSGIPVISLGIGSPDKEPDVKVIERLSKESVVPTNHGYQSYKGIPELRNAFAKWYRKYYGVKLNRENQIQILTGSKEGILLLSMAFLNKGDKVLIPNPSYPTYTSATKLVEAEPIPYSLCENNGWQPDFGTLESMDLTGVKMMWVNYPNMPTGAKASMELYKKIVKFGQRHKILICSDNPYSFILNEEHLSILSVEGAMDCCVELNSLSKALNMAGWRVGMIAGAADVVATVLKVKSNMDSGIFRPLQLAAVEALSLDEEWYDKLNCEYRKRRVVAEKIADALGFTYDKNSGGLFLWAKINDSWPNGESVSDYLLKNAAVFVTPGFIFGSVGDKYIRISLCATVDTLETALKRVSESLLKKHNWKK